MSSSEPIGPGDPDYLPADRQLHPTVGPDVGADELDVDLLERVIDRIDQLPRPDWGDDLDGIPVSADGRHLSLPPADLPGFGEEYDNCGDDIPHFCEGCGAKTTIGRTCKRSSCPRCAPAWCRDRTISATSRLAAARAALDAVKDDHQRYHHLAINLPDDWRIDAENPLEKTRQMIISILKEMDLQGYLFYHPYRGRTDTDEDDRGKWKDRLFNDREWRDVSRELSLRPHFHAIVIGHEVPGGQFTKILHDETEIVLKRITKSEESNVSIYNERGLARSTSYCISHTGLVRKGDEMHAEYQPFGEAVHPSDGVDVLDRTRDEMDRIVREEIPMTLGVALGSQLCVSNVPEGESESSARSRIISQAAADDPEDPTKDFDDELAGSGETLIEGEEIEDVELTECEGKLRHIRDAPRFLDNAEWRAEARYWRQLQTTWDEWSDRLDELPGG